MKKALVLAGGGTRGSYQNGALKALREIQEDNFDIVTGTSIGSLNGALVVQHDYEGMDELWHNLSQDQIIKGDITLEFNLDTMINERNLIVSFFKKYIQEQGADISPFIEMVKKYYNAEKFKNSSIDYGCVTVHHGSLKPVYVTKEMVIEDPIDWLVSSCSAFPAFPVHTFDKGSFVDGGYYDNLPIDLALQLGADEVVAIDLNNTPQHQNYMYSSNIKYLHPHIEVGSFLNFDKQTILDLETFGYNDAMKLYQKYDGMEYTFESGQIPNYYHAFGLEFMLLEHEIKDAFTIKQKITFRGERYLQEHLKDITHLEVMNEYEIFYSLIDTLMHILELDNRKVWKYEEVQSRIVDAFEECTKKDFAYLPKLHINDVFSYISTLDKKGIIEKILHLLIYEEHRFVDKQVLLTICPFETCLAVLIKDMMKEEGKL